MASVRLNPSSPELRDALPEPALSYTMRSELKRSYQVVWQDHLLSDGYTELVRRLRGRAGLLIATPTVAELYGKAMSYRLKSEGIYFPLLVIDGGESGKNLDQVRRICAAGIDQRLHRTSLLVAIGGGVCSDIVSMAASWIRRGIGTARIPTTLIGQVDAAIGVKGGVNFVGKKNAVGCFHPPEWVLIDRAFLLTLPEREIRVGMAEIAKMAIIRDDRLFGLLEEHGTELIRTRFRSPEAASREVIQRAVRGMLEELASNLFEDRTYRRRVDFGHTLSPLLEAESEYAIAHGEAVAIDIAISACTAAELGLLAPSVRERILSLLKLLGLPIASPLLSDDLLTRAIAESTRHRGGSTNLVLPTGIGEATILANVGSAELQALQRARDRLVASRFVRVGAPGTERCLVYDIGGTNLRGGLYRRDSDAITHVRVVPTPQFASFGVSAPEAFSRLVDRIVEIGDAILGGGRPEIACVAFPGPVDSDGRIQSAPTVWGKESLPPANLAGDLHRYWPESRIHVINDVSAAGYRYLRKRGEDFCIVTVSSGIGNKVFIGGEPMIGIAGRGGEIGHVRVPDEMFGMPCDCGDMDHIGAISSGRGTLAYAIRHAKRDVRAFLGSAAGAAVGRPEALTNEVLVAAFRAGDSWTRRVIRDTSRPLGQALAMLHAALGVERFVVIGGFALALGQTYREQLVQHATNAVWKIGQDWDAMVELGSADDLSGLIGAGRHATRFFASPGGQFQ